MIKVVGHRILVKSETLPNKTKSGIIVEYSAIEKRALDKGTVIDIGSTAYKTEVLGGIPWVKVGDRISYVRYSGHQMVDPANKDDEYTILNDEDVMAILSKEDLEEVKND